MKVKKYISCHKDGSVQTRCYKYFVPSGLLITIKFS
jgi:hypothetical protein